VLTKLPGFVNGSVNLIRSGARSTAGKVLTSVADQGTASGTNFVVNVLLARWLTRADYGAFSVSWSFCIIFAAFHNALILEPMTVIGPAEYSSGLSQYLAVVRRLNWYTILALGVLAAIAAFFYREIPVKHALETLSICLPGYLLLLMRRREQYVLNQPRKALQLSLAYACIVAALLALLHAIGWMSALTGLVCIGASLPVALWGFTTGPEGDLRSVAKAHWHYGRWLFASSILAVGIPDMQTILLSVMVDLKAAGALRALMNFILPLPQLLTVLSVYALPRLSYRMKRDGVGRGLRQAIVFPAAMIGLSFAYVGLLLAGGGWLEKTLYNGRMAQYVTYIPMLALATLLAAIGAGFSTLLRAAQNSQHQLISGVVGTVTGVGAALLLLKRYGLSGAITSMVLANAASSLCIVGIYIWMLRKRPASWILS
jgi:O-antigen/teichoic acid export membrane protein